MELFGNIEVFVDDNEIIDIAMKFPPIKKDGNVSLLKLLEDESENMDFFTMLDFQGKVYTFYKFDTNSMKSEKDGGLLMTASKPEHVLDQLNWWKAAKHAGMDFRPGLYAAIDAQLNARFALFLFERAQSR